MEVFKSSFFVLMLLCIIGFIKPYNTNANTKINGRAKILHDARKKINSNNEVFGEYDCLSTKKANFSMMNDFSMIWNEEYLYFYYTNSYDYIYTIYRIKIKNFTDESFAEDRSEKYSYKSSLEYIDEKGFFGEYGTTIYYSLSPDSNYLHLSYDKKYLRFKRLK